MEAHPAMTHLILPLTLAALFAAASLTVSAQAQEGPRLPSDELFTNPRRAERRFDGFSYTARERQEEAAEKVRRVRRMLADRRLDGLLVATERNLNWLTAGGKDNVVWVQRETPVKLLVTADRLYLVADNIEGPRMMSEELQGLGYEWVRFNWYQAEKDVLGPLVRGKKLAFDHAATAAAYDHDPNTSIPDLMDVYYPITQGELKKYRWLGRKTSEVLETVGRAVRPGMSEYDVQYLLAREFWYWDILPTVLLSAVDERFKVYRHPVVVGERMRSYVALNVCTRRWGLTVSTTRLVHFGEPDEKLKRAWAEGPKVGAAYLAASKPGNTFGDVFAAGQKAYADMGFPEEWKLHHQGGPILGLERLVLVQPGDRTPIRAGMVLAWNPTVQGTKFEDTVYVRENGTLENLTAPIDWPTAPVTIGGTTYRIPTLLVRPKP
jgi:antitoxin VapB